MRRLGQHSACGNISLQHLNSVAIIIFYQKPENICFKHYVSDIIGSRGFLMLIFRSYMNIQESLVMVKSVRSVRPDTVCVCSRKCIHSVRPQANNRITTGNLLSFFFLMLVNYLTAENIRPGSEIYFP